jgi:ferredoxin
MKTVRIEPIGAEMDVKTLTPIVVALIKQTQNKVKMVCGGKGLCATCHVSVVDGFDSLTSLTQRERDTLSRITSAGINSRLACQARVMGEGCAVKVPEGIYLESLADLEALIGRRAEVAMCHPVTGQNLVPEGKIITRSVVMSLQETSFNIIEVLQNSGLTN